MLKFHGYIDWSQYGMRPCYWCFQSDLQEKIGYIGAIATFVLLICIAPAHVLHSKLSKHRRQDDYEYQQELEPQYDYSSQQEFQYHQQQQPNYHEQQKYQQQYQQYNQQQYQQQYQPQYQQHQQYLPQSSYQYKY